MANEAERRRWNDPECAAMWPRREALTDRVTPFLLEVLALEPGETVLDVGCGGGGVSLAAARAVAPGGRVIAADVSVPLIDLARQRAQRVGVTNLSLLVADVQTDRLGDGGYDVATSQFGVMFFDDPFVAFANIGRHLRPGGRLSFACWQPIERNPWFAGPTLAPYLPPPPPPAEGKHRIGPFTLGDPARVEEILASAGFVDTRVSSHETVAPAAGSTVIDRDQLVLIGIEPDHLDAAGAAIERHLAQFGDPSGLCRFPLAFHLVSARRP